MKKKSCMLALLLVLLLCPAAARADEMPTPAAGEYAFAWISDPQHYSAKYPELYTSMTESLSDHREELNLQYVICTGDLVNDYDDLRQWRTALTAFRALDGVPYGVLAGNHDFRLKEQDGNALYRRYFGSARASKNACFVDSFEDNRGHTDLIDAGNTKYVFVYMSYRPDNAAIDYMIKSFAAYPDRVGVLCLHDCVDGSMRPTRDGKKIYSRVVSAVPNLYVVLCGHEYGVGLREDTYENPDGSTRTVYTMLQNYQAASRGGEGYFRLLFVNEAASTLAVRTYSAANRDENYFDTPGRSHIDRNYTFDTSLERFTLPLPWKTY